MMEEDGLMIWAGYFVSAGTLIYFILIAHVVLHTLHKIIQMLFS